MFVNYFYENFFKYYKKIDRFFTTNSLLPYNNLTTKTRQFKQLKIEFYGILQLL